MRRIVFVTRADGVGGTEKHLLDLVDRLEPSEFEVIILTMGGDPFSAHFRSAGRGGVRVIAGPSSGKWMTAWKAFRDIEPDVIVFVNGDIGLFHWQMYLAARASGADRVIAIEHLIAPLPRKKNVLRRRVTSRMPGLVCHATLCVSEAVRDRLVREYLYPRKKTITRHNGVDLKWFSRGALKSVPADPPSNGAPVVVCVSRFVPQKRIDVLIRAMKRVAERFPDVSCVLVGGGMMEQQLRSLVRELGLERNVHFAGEAKDVRPFLARANVFALPSEREGLPLSLLEAMAFGLPCVATEAGGNREVISDGTNGWIVPVGSDAAMAEAIEKLLGDPAEMVRMGRNALRTVQERFDIECSMRAVKSAILGSRAELREAS
jgi:glycosyltransferase involved in cell wall biosynthesis